MLHGAVGRTVEAHAIADFLDRASAEPSALVIVGEAGIGKTTLWLGAVEQARDHGMRVLAARAAAAESVMAYGALADLLSEVDQSVWSDLPDAQRRAIGRVLQYSESDGPDTDARAVAAGFRSTMERLAAECPVLIAVDDVQWLDPSSRKVLAFVTRRLSGPVGLVATERTQPNGGGASSWLELFRPESTQTLTLGPMSLGGLHALLTERLGTSFPRPVMVQIAQVSGGNPFFALELARGMAGAPPGSDVPLPGTLAEVVRARIGELDSEVQDALLAVSCLGEPTVDVVAGVIGRDVAHTVGLLEAAEGQGIVAIDGNRSRFSHPLLARGVYLNVTPATRRAMHRRVADVLAEPELKARHLAMSTTVGDEHTLQSLDRAARAARKRGAPAAAAELLDMAIKLGGDTAERRIRSARYHLDTGDTAQPRRLLETTIEGLAPGALRSKALAQLAAVQLFDDHFLEAATLLERALGECGDNLAQRAQILVSLAFALENNYHFDAAVANLDEAVRHAEQLGYPPLLCQALTMRVHLRFLWDGTVDEAGLTRALELEDPDAPIPPAFRPSFTNGMLLAWTGKLEDARDELLGVRQRCEEHGEEMEILPVAFNSFLVEMWRGNPAAAATIADDAMERALQLGGDLSLGMAQTMQAAVAAHAGREQEARAAASQALAASERCGSIPLTVWPITILGFLELSVDDHEAAIKALQPALDVLETAPIATEIITTPFVPDAAETLVELGRLEQAERLIDRFEHHGQRRGRHWAMATGARCRSLLQAAQGDIDTASRTAEEALRVHDRLPMPFARARTQLVLGRIQRRQRRKDTAASTLREAVAVFDELGARLWTQRARAELARAAVTPSGVGSLTESERRVADLAAAGRTNRDVAAALFISPKTVEANLARIYRKLGIRSRAELGRHIGGAQV